MSSHDIVKYILSVSLYRREIIEEAINHGEEVLDIMINEMGIKIEASDFMKSLETGNINIIEFIMNEVGVKNIDRYQTYHSIFVRKFWHLVPFMVENGIKIDEYNLLYLLVGRYGTFEEVLPTLDYFFIGKGYVLEGRARNEIFEFFDELIGEGKTQCINYITNVLGYKNPRK